MTQITLPTGQVVFNDWYASEKGRHVMGATDGGMLMFVWEATLDDGTVIRQYDDVNFTRAMTDESFVPPEGSRLSVDALDKEHVSQFRVFPIAFTKANAPCFQEPVVVYLNLKRGERLTSFWETDFTPRTGYTIRRTVVGIKRLVAGEEVILNLVISPSGQLSVSSDTNRSFEGE